MLLEISSVPPGKLALELPDPRILSVLEKGPAVVPVSVLLLLAPVAVGN
jgi:hypothetical protein